MKYCSLPGFNALKSHGIEKRLEYFLLFYSESANRFTKLPQSCKIPLLAFFNYLKGNKDCSTLKQLKLVKKALIALLKWKLLVLGMPVSLTLNNVDV